MRNCEVLSMTTAPFFAALGEYSADTLAPGEENTSSVPLKSKVARFCTFTSSSPKEISLPTERSEASAAMSSTGNARSASVFIIRSEEHTSELQSLMRISYAVFCLKKINKSKVQTTAGLSTVQKS